MIPPPRRKRPRRTPGAKHGKRKNEEGQETGSVKGARHQVRVVLEDAGAVVSEIELREESRDELAEDDAGLTRVVGDIAGEL